MSDDKTKYLVHDKDGKGHLPYTDASGSVSHRLMGAAWAALHGGYRGNKYEGPNKSEAISKLTALYKSEGMKTPSKRDQIDGELRFVNDSDFDSEFRVESRGESKSKLITGYPAKFNRKSRDLGGFRENILPGAFSRSIAEGDDVRALMNHDPNLVLGRTKAGTATLKEDATGLRMEVDPADTQTCRDLMCSIDRGDIDQGSFRFRCRSDNWRMENGENIRDLEDVELRDVSIVTFPAYEDTTATVRSVSELAGINFNQLASVLVRIDHNLEVSSEDRAILGEAIEALEKARRDTADPLGTMAAAKNRLAIAQRELE